MRTRSACWRSSARAYLVAIGLSWQATNLPDWVLPVMLAWGTTSITGVAYFSAESPSPLIFFYLWIFLYSAYFFDDRITLVQVGYAGVAQRRAVDRAAAAERRARSGGSWRWGRCLVGAILIRSMRGRVESLIERLYDTARTDPLTDLPNRRGFRELLDLELERARRRDSHADRARRRSRPLQGGQRPLGPSRRRRRARSGSRGCSRDASGPSTPRRGSAARSSRSSFPTPTSAEAYVVAERLRGPSSRRSSRDDAVPITISFGIATLSASTAQTAGSLLRAGDEALYGAKRNGRNRSMIHTSDAARGRPRRRPSATSRASASSAAMLDLAEAVDLRFSGSARHSETVGRYAEMMAAELGLSEERVRRVRLAGVLHDIGKVLIPEAILQKPGALDDEEFELIKRHPEFGAQILDHPALADVRGWVGSHHERPDGSRLSARDLRLRSSRSRRGSSRSPTPTRR